MLTQCVRARRSLFSTCQPVKPAGILNRDLGNLNRVFTLINRAFMLLKKVFGSSGLIFYGVDEQNWRVIAIFVGRE